MSIDEQPFTKTNEKSLTDFVICLDLDETLIRTLSILNDEEAALKVGENLGIYTNPELLDIRLRSFRLTLDDPVTPKGTGVQHGCWGITRPHLKEFLTFCFTYFRKVCIWSAGVETYVNDIAKFISRDLRKFDIIFSRSECQIVKMPEGDEYTKPLSFMISRHPEVGPIEKMFVIDDRKVTFMHNPECGIEIPLYKPAPDINQLRTEDDHLLRLKYWFLQPEVMKCKDIRKLDKTKIFNIKPAEYLQKR